MYGKSNLPARCIAETAATFILCLIGAGAAVADAAFGIGGLLYHHVILAGRDS